MRSLLWIILSLSLPFTISGGTIKPVTILKECCQLGESLGHEIYDKSSLLMNTSDTATLTQIQTDLLLKNAEQCYNLTGKQDLNVPPEMISVCLFTQQMCCSKQLRLNECQMGVMAAKEGRSCLPFDLYEEYRTHYKESANSVALASSSNDLMRKERLSVRLATESNQMCGLTYFKDCCESCKVGMLMVGLTGSCNPSNTPFPFDILIDNAYKQCCTPDENNAPIPNSVDDPTGTFVLTEKDNDLCGMFDKKLCDHICENTDDSYVCKCRKGYRLAEDRIKCLKISDDDEENNTEIDDNSNSDCMPGFKFDPSRDECIDIDECELEIAKCPHNQICNNKPGGYDCLVIVSANHINNKVVDSEDECEPGYRFNELHECDDIDECIEFPTICGSGKYVCKNLPGHYECVHRNTTVTTTPRSITITKETPINCPLGYEPSHNSCVDIDECQRDKHACDSNQQCVNEPGGYQCACRLGFTLDPVTKACVDVNECQINNHDCLETQRCDNTIGSYTCIRLQSCGTGYTLNAETGKCDDDDECALGRHNCYHPQYECKNTKGSFRCVRIQQRTTTPHSSPYYRPTPPTTYSPRYPVASEPCPTGFQRNHLGACTDINECALPHPPCRRDQKCQNTNGGYRCITTLQCMPGYSPNAEATQCVDIDECAIGTANCGPDQICRNKPGGYVCNCPTGYIQNSHQRCEDVDECTFYKMQVCPTNSVCRNTPGSYRCDCKEGFKRPSASTTQSAGTEGKTCVDIDECSEIQGLCEQKCVNYWGSYRCTCDVGYRLNPANNRSCSDIDECEEHKSSRLCMGQCENTGGSYKCTCPRGYTLSSDGRTCQDINECETQSICRNYNEICTNTRGSYRCSQINCPPDYILDPERRNRCKRISLECLQDDLACWQKPATISYSFITLSANMSIRPEGIVLFTFQGPSWFENIDFDMSIKNVHVPRNRNVTPATDRDFSMQKNGNEVKLRLLRSLDGPQDIDLDLSVTTYRDGRIMGSNVAKTLIIVSEYDF